jgi:hypothetical protein
MSLSATSRYEKRKPYRLMFTPRPCMRTPRPAARLLRGACSEAAGWAAWHRFKKRVQMGIAKLGRYKLVGPQGEMAWHEVQPERAEGANAEAVTQAPDMS